MPEAAAAKKEWLTEFKDVFSDEKTGRAQVREYKESPPEWVPVDKVFRFPFISINLPNYQVVQIDVDEPDCDADPIIPPAFDLAPYHWLDIPPPNFTVVSSGQRFHAFWLLERSLPFKASPTSLQFFHDVRQKLAHALGGDVSCNVRGSARNPFYRKAHARCFSKERNHLREVNPRHITIPARTYRNQAHKYVEGNRNRVTFNVVLRRYKELGEKASTAELFEYARRFQGHCDAEALPDSENWSIASSVRRNGHKYRVSADRNYGAMGLEAPDWGGMSPEERRVEIRRRQSMGAYWMHDKRKERTKARLELAIQELQREGQKITQRAVAERSGCSTQTINAYWPILRFEMVNG